MIAVIKGDIIGSRKQKDSSVWLNPLKELLSQWGNTPQQWEVVWGDFFQIELPKPEDALTKALTIKALLKHIEPVNTSKTKSTMDVRMAIGIGEKTYEGSSVSQSNGPAFVYSGDKFDTLRKEKTTLAIKSPWSTFDEEINLYLRLAGTFVDSWSVSSGQIAYLVLQNQHIKQDELGALLGIKQNSVSGRWNRAHMDEIVEIEKAYRKKINTLLP